MDYKDIRHIRTLEELTAALGPLTAAEFDRLADPALYAPPTQAEIARLPRNFSRLVMRLARKRRPR